MRDLGVQAEPAGARQELQVDRSSKGLTAGEWAQLVNSGAITYTVGQPANWIGAFADRSEAEALADEHSGTFVQWTGRTGHLVTTAEYDLELGAR
jgi:hypothetical protein